MTSLYLKFFLSKKLAHTQSDDLPALSEGYLESAVIIQLDLQ